MADAKENDLVILSGNAVPGVPSDVYALIIERLREKKIRCILDDDGALFREGIKARPYAIKTNRFELAQYFDLPEDELSAEKMIELGSRFLNKDIRLVAISMGIEESLFLSAEEVISAPALKIDYQSSASAGDCTIQGTQPAALTVVEELRARVHLNPLSR